MFFFFFSPRDFRAGQDFLKEEFREDSSGNMFKAFSCAGFWVIFPWVLLKCFPRKVQRGVLKFEV